MTIPVVPRQEAETSSIKPDTVAEETAVEFHRSVLWKKEGFIAEEKAQ